MKEKIKLAFFGKEYSVVTDAEKDYLMEIVEYLEQKITKAAKDSRSVSVTIPPPVFLASLEIVDDFFALKREFDEFKKTSERKTKELVYLLESSGSQEEPLFFEESTEDPFRSRGKSL